MSLAPMIAEARLEPLVFEPTDEILERNSLKEGLAKLADLGGDDFVVEMVQLLSTQTALQIKELEAAHTSGDLPTAQRLAHSMKSSFGNFGAKKLQTLACTMEFAAKNGDKVDYEKHVLDLKNGFSKLITTIRSL